MITDAHRRQVSAPHFVALGASGSEGLSDIIAVLRGLAKPVPAIVMVVLHRPSDAISGLREVLARHCVRSARGDCRGGRDPRAGRMLPR